MSYLQLREWTNMDSLVQLQLPQFTFFLADLGKFYEFLHWVQLDANKQTCPLQNVSGVRLISSL